ncbi:MAG TPA: serine hydrolase [Cyclobacteriaceae bacterium]|nr:serine hydrolase [Cyclobacteriaceae bacterium]
MRNFLFLLLLGCLFSCEKPIKEDESLIENLMLSESSTFKSIIDNKDKLEVQIIYTMINRDDRNRPSFKSFYYNVDSTRYFYPASTVKLPMALLALEKLNHLNIKGLDKFTPMFSDSVYAGQFSVSRDSTSENGLPSIAHYTRKILVVSDNDAYNRLYEFVGQKAINDSLSKKGYYATILHRLERPLPPDQNRHTEAKRFVRNDTVMYQQNMLVNSDSILPKQIVLKGKSHYDNFDNFSNTPFDFTYKNFYPITTQTMLLRALLFPETVPYVRQFHVTEKDRQFVLQYMSQLPRETSFPPYYQYTALYYDAYCKFLMYGKDHKKIPSSVRIFNKVGDAYGYLIDNAYIIDFDNQVEFMISAVINCNVGDVYNNDSYAYDSVGYPFMKNLGQVIYNYELNRKRDYKPDLSAFRFTYDR